MLREQVVIKLLAVAAVLSLFSCGGKPKPDSDAVKLYDAAQNQYNNGSPDSAVSLIDSLSRMYPDEIALQRKAMYLRTLASDKIIRREIKKNDSVLTVDPATKSKLEGNFRYVKDPQMIEGYRVDRAVGGPLESGTTIQPRIDEYGDIYLASILTGHHIHYTTITVSSGAASVSSAPARNDSFDNRELVTFHGGKCDTLCMFIAENATRNLRLTFSGRGSYSMTLPYNVKQAVARTYRYVKASKSAHEAQGRKIYFEKRLEINSKQMLKTKPKN